MSFVRNLLAAGATFAVALTALAHPVATPPSQANPTARGLTLALLNANAQYAAAPASQRSQALAKLLAVAQSRHDQLAALAEDDPAEFLRVALPANLRAGLPPQVSALLEQDVTAQGVLGVYHVDYVNPPGEEYLYALDTGTETFSLHFAANPPTLLSGSQVRVQGLRLDTAVVLANGSGAQSNVTTLAAALPNTLGAQKTLVMLVNFYDEATQPFTQSSAQSTVFTTVSNYWYEASYQQTTVVGDVVPWYTSPDQSYTTCNYSTIASEADKNATALGYNLANYTRKVYAMAGNACSWWGLGTVGGNPSQAWVNTKYGFTLPVIGHEMGHNLGLYHSHSLDCGSVSYATSGCTASEYGDVFDIMGNPGTTPHYNAFQKELLGWLNAGNSPPLISVPAQTGSAQYTIEPMEKANDAVPRALKIPMSTACTSTTQYYYVESRQAQGFDSFLSGNANVLGGVLVHNATAGDGNSSYLLDMTPATTSWSDAALDAGIAYVDPVSGLSITPVSVGSSSTTVAVSFPSGTCTRSAPTIALAPSGTDYTAPGATASYTATVTNNDGCGCAASSFNVAASVPTGWSATSPTTGSVMPGASTSVSLGITPASTAAPAYYTVPSTATNVNAPAYAATANATIAVVASLGVSVSTGQATYTRPAKRNQTVNVAITTTVTSGGSPVSGASVSVQVKGPTGKLLATLSGTTGSNGSAVVSYGIKSSSATGTYTVTSTGTLSGMSSSGTTTFTVQ